MDGRRYQVFVSSTFRDLVDARQAVLDGILQLGHFPAGMETFPAANGTPWEVIQRVIDESDYYVVVVGGRYGSTDEAGIGYTEKEYDYAVQTGKCVLPFLHGKPDRIPVGDSDTDMVAIQKLEAFRAKLEAKHHRRYWDSPLHLQSLVIVALTNAIATHPAPGWVRGGGFDEVELLQRLAELQQRYDLMSREREQLQEKLSDAAAAAPIEDGTHAIRIKFDVQAFQGHEGGLGESVQATVEEVFMVTAPILRWPTSYDSIAEKVSAFVAQLFIGTERSSKFPQFGFADRKQLGRMCTVKNTSIETLMSNLALRGLVEPVSYSKSESFIIGPRKGQPRTKTVHGWKLTDRGLKRFAEASLMKGIAIEEPESEFLS